MISATTKQNMRLRRELMAVFSENLRQLASDCGFTYEQMALMAHIDPSTFSQYTRGWAFPNTVTLYKICQTFDVSMDDMLKNWDLGANETA